MIFVTKRLKSTIFVIKSFSFDFVKFICNKYWSYYNIATIGLFNEITLFIMKNAKLFSPCTQEIRYIETSLYKRSFIG